MVSLPTLIRRIFTRRTPTADERIEMARREREREFIRLLMDTYRQRRLDERRRGWD